MARAHLFFLLLALTVLVIEQTHGCSWPGHCIGARCNDYNDCADDLICGIYCPTHGCGGTTKQCMSPSFGRRRRRDVINTLLERSNEVEN